MAVLGTLFIGLIVGLVARFLMPGRDAMGFLLTIVLGIAGAFLGTWLGQGLGFYRPEEPAGFLMATFGAMLLLGISRALKVRRV